MPVRIEADYLLETAFDPRHAAETIAGEQSSGTFVAIPGETPELKARAAARVEAAPHVSMMMFESRPCRLPQPQRHASTWRRALVTLSWPLDNLGPSLAQPHRHGGRQPVRAEASLRPAPARHAPARRLRGQPIPARSFGIEGTRRLAGVRRPAR